MPEHERPRERALRYGIGALSNRELLAILIRHGNSQCSALEIADEILLQSQGLNYLAAMSMEDLTKIKGLKQAKGLELLACFELGKRIGYENCLKKDVIQDSASLIHWLKQEIGTKQQEMFLAVYLDPRNQILYHEILFKGAQDQSLVDPREVFRRALLCHSTRIIVVHNHPSGNPEPSLEDIYLTDKLKEAGELMKIELLDHIIVCMNHTFSFKEAGLLD